IRDESDRCTVITLDLNPPQRDCQPRITSASEHDLGVRYDLEAITVDFAYVTVPDHTQARVCFHPGNEESLGIIDLFPPAKVAIPLVEHVSRARFDLDLTPNLNVI